MLPCGDAQVVQDPGQVEQADLLMSYGHTYIAWNEPAVPPAGECLPTHDDRVEIARAR
jgi:hypothetical protein